jgi:chromosome segregation ATPase
MAANNDHKDRIIQ